MVHKITFAKIVCNFHIKYQQEQVNCRTKGVKILYWDYQVLNRPFNETMDEINSLMKDPRVSNLQIDNMTSRKQIY